MSLGLFIRDATGTSRAITALQIRDGGDIIRDITELWIRDLNNTPRLVFNPSGSASLSVSVAPGLVRGFSQGTGTATTGTATATGAGGVAPYTYAWTCNGFDSPVSPTATAASSDTTAFTLTSMDAGGIYTSDWRVTVTDSATPPNTAFDDSLNANFADLSV